MSGNIYNLPLWEDFPHELPGDFTVRKGIFKRLNAYGTHILESPAVVFFSPKRETYIYYDADFFDKTDWELIVKPRLLYSIRD